MIFAVAFGLITRKSYKHFEYDDAVITTFYQEHNMKSAEEFLKENVIIARLHKISSAFVVTVKSSERNYHSTKATVLVDKVIKGDASELNKEIVIYEANYSLYEKSTGIFQYVPAFSFNNIMQEGERYLVFVKKIDYADVYNKTLSRNEYTVDWLINSVLYSFPLDAKIECVEPHEGLTFADIKGHPYICYTAEHAKLIDNIWNAVLKEFM